MCFQTSGDLGCDIHQVYPCVFDIHQSQCIHIQDAPSSFDCGVRCIRTWTTVVEETTMHFEVVTEDHDNSTDNDGTGDGSGGGGGSNAGQLLDSLVLYGIYMVKKYV